MTSDVNKGDALFDLLKETYDNMKCLQAEIGHLEPCMQIIGLNSIYKALNWSYCTKGHTKGVICGGLVLCNVCPL